MGHFRRKSQKGPDMSDGNPFILENTTWVNELARGIDNTANMLKSAMDKNPSDQHISEFAKKSLQSVSPNHQNWLYSAIHMVPDMKSRFEEEELEKLKGVGLEGGISQSKVMPNIFQTEISGSRATQQEKTSFNEDSSISVAFHASSEKEELDYLYSIFQPEVQNLSAVNLDADGNEYPLAEKEMEDFFHLLGMPDPEEDLQILDQVFTSEVNRVENITKAPTGVVSRNSSDALDELPEASVYHTRKFADKKKTHADFVIDERKQKKVRFLE